MASIDIKRKHDKPLKDAKKSVERVAKQIADKFDVEYDWSGNTLNFSRSGVDGKIAVSAKEVHVLANLGFLLMAIKGPVEREILRYLEEEFS
jgi:putative polyhydroxyalkanoate system protein